MYDLITLLSSCQNCRERRRSSLLVCVYNCTSLSSLYTYVNADCRLFAVLFVYSVYCTSSGYLVGLLYAMTSRFPFPSLLEITQCQFLTFFWCCDRRDSLPPPLSSPLQHHYPQLTALSYLSRLHQVMFVKSRLIFRFSYSKVYGEYKDLEIEPSHLTSLIFGAIVWISKVFFVLS